MFFSKCKIGLSATEIIRMDDIVFFRYTDCKWHLYLGLV